MTRCGRAASINLKSSVYNPNGQSYFDQLATYNSMACHLRRILTAKSVVETRNERYTRSKQRQELKGEKIKRTSYRSPSCEIIDRLAYDTEHHPADILKATNSSKSNCYRRSRQSREDSPMTCKGCQKSTSKSRSPCKQEDCWYNKKYSRNSSGQRKSNVRGEAKCQVVRQTQSPAYSSDFASDDSSSHLSGNESNDPKHLSSKKLMLHAEKEEARYAQFVYDITQDIVKKGLYTDKEFKEVFRRHLEKNAGILDKHRMLYEIYQLKISLNIDDEDDEDYKHLANYIYSKRFSASSKPKPPTPPKVLDDNKVVEKLKNYEQLMDKQPGFSAKKKNVVLVDANPEIVITERDILQTLIETNVDPNQAERICRTLFYKSKDTTSCQMAKNETENVSSQPARENNEKMKQSATTRKKRNTCTCNARPCTCVTERKIVEPKNSNFEYRDVSSTVNSKPQEPFGYDKLLNIVSECSQVTRTILEQRTKVQRLKLKEEANSRREERQRKIREAEMLDEKMERVLSGDNDSASGKKNVTAVSNSEYESAVPDFVEHDELLDPKMSGEFKQTWLDVQKLTEMNSEEGKKEKRDDLPSVINEKDEDKENTDEDNYLDDYEEDNLTERDESEAVSYSMERQEKSRSSQKDDENNEDTSVQYSGSVVDQKDSASVSKDEILDVTVSNDEKRPTDKSEDLRENLKSVSSKRSRGKPNCVPGCNRRMKRSCIHYSKCEIQRFAMQNKNMCLAARLAKFEDEQSDSN